MHYNSTSVKEIVPKIIRNARISDASVIADALEWIDECVLLMGMPKQVFESRYSDVTVEFYRAKFPCKLKELFAVEYCGRRVRMQHFTRTYSAEQLTPAQPVWESTYSEVTTPGNAKMYVSRIVDLNTLPYDEQIFYYIENGHVVLNIKDAEVRLHYKVLPMDNEGFTMIPDNPNYKQALWFYVIAHLIGAGHAVPQKWSYEFAYREYETYRDRANGEITYPDVNEMEQRVQMHQQLITDPSYFSNFFISDINNAW